VITLRNRSIRVMNTHDLFGASATTFTPPGILLSVLIMVTFAAGG